MLICAIGLTPSKQSTECGDVVTSGSSPLGAEKDDMTTKIVTVIQRTKLVYEVEGDTDVAGATDIVKARMRAQSPLGLVEETTKTERFEVGLKGSKEKPIIVKEQ